MQEAGISRRYCTSSICGYVLEAIPKMAGQKRIESIDYIMEKWVEPFGDIVGVSFHRSRFK